MHHRLFIILFSQLLCFSSAAQGMGDWQNKTPGGHEMYDPGGGTRLVLTKTGTEVNEIKAWYFYQQHIIGMTYDGFFIVNEKNEEVRHFTSAEAWHRHKTAAGLTPPFWTRWYSGNWRFHEQMIFLLLFIILFILFPLLTYFVLNVNRWISTPVKHRIKQWPLAIASALLLLCVCRYLLDLYPQSY